MRISKNVVMFLGLLASAVLIVGVGKAEDAAEKDLSIDYRYRTLPAGAVKPEGWIRKQMLLDMKKGLTGHYKDINHTVTHELFVRSDRISGRKYEGLKAWWSGEHEGYWKDSLIRMSYLTDHLPVKKKATGWVDNILQSTGPSGYIGMYARGEEPNHRYRHKGQNGELWTQSRILMGMLAYSRYTDDENILEAVERAVQRSIRAYENKNPFAVSGSSGGVSHAVGFFEVLDTLYRMTGNDAYLEFAVKLYRDFNKAPPRDDDLTVSNLLDTERKFRAHGAHIAEGFLAPQFIAEITGEDKYISAAQEAIKKLEYHTTPSGAMVCSEDVNGMRGTADRFYEYCSNVELINPLCLIISMTGKLSLADRVEKMTFNALQGARLHPDLQALSYLTSDNRIQMHPERHGGRETYDACHRAAACCTLNGGRVMPYYVQNMWMKNSGGNGVTAVLYGPNTLKTTLNGTDISIQEKTAYPFSDEVVFDISMARSTKFKLCLRKPFGSDAAQIHGVDQEYVADKGEYYVINKRWPRHTTLTVSFDFQIRRVQQPASESVPLGGAYITRGPLVYALPFPYTRKTLREHNDSGFHNYVMKPKTRTEWHYRLPDKPDFTFAHTENRKTEKPFTEPLVCLKGKLLSPSGKAVETRLVPLGNTLFRRVTFPKNMTSAAYKELFDGDDASFSAKMQAVEALAHRDGPMPDMTSRLIDFASEIGKKSQLNLLTQALQTVKDENIPPKVSDFQITCQEGGSCKFQPPMDDPDDLELTLKADFIESPAEGSITKLDSRTFRYTSGYQAPGTYEAIWRARDENNKSRPAKMTIKVMPDTDSPELIRAYALDDRSQLVAIFNEPVTRDTAGAAENYSIEPGVEVQQVSLQDDARTVLLNISSLDKRKEYTLTATSITDKAKSANTQPETEKAVAFFPDVGGLMYEYIHPHKNNTGMMPNFEALEITRTGTTDRPSVDVASHEDNFALRFTGQLRISETGTYTFRSVSDDGSRLYIDDRLVVDNPGLHAKKEESGTVNLRSGTHNIRITYFERTGGQHLAVSWKTPSSEWQKLPKTLLTQPLQTSSAPDMGGK